MNLLECCLLSHMIKHHRDLKGDNTSCFSPTALKLPSITKTRIQVSDLQVARFITQMQGCSMLSRYGIPKLPCSCAVQTPRMGSASCCMCHSKWSFAESSESIWRPLTPIIAKVKLSMGIRYITYCLYTLCCATLHKPSVLQIHNMCCQLDLTTATCWMQVLFLANAGFPNTVQPVVCYGTMILLLLKLKYSVHETLHG